MKYELLNEFFNFFKKIILGVAIWIEKYIVKNAQTRQWYFVKYAFGPNLCMSHESLTVGYLVSHLQVGGQVWNNPRRILETKNMVVSFNSFKKPFLVFFNEKNELRLKNEYT